MEEVDHLGERENGSVSCEGNGYRRHDDEKGFHVVRDRLRGGSARKEREAKVDEDEIFGKLGEGGKDVFGGTLSPSRHGVVGVMLESNSTEEEGDDAGHTEAVREEVAGICR